MNNELKQQSQEIDSPETPTTEPIRINLRELQNSFVGTLPAPMKAQQAAQGISDRMAPQMQGEFANFDVDLDRGIISGDDQNEVRAKNQGWWAETGRGLVKAANELVLGTLEATALMSDVSMHTEAMLGTEQEFTNSIAKYLGEAKDAINEKYGKVYVSKANQGFSPGSWEFWMSNADSMATAITLMVPSMAASLAITKGIGALTKGSKVLRASRLGRAVVNNPGVVKGLVGATVSRLTENAMEASEAVHSVKASMYEQDGVTPKVNPKSPIGARFTEEEIAQIAGEAGVNTWRMGIPMLAMDFMQYSKAFKGIDYARRTVEKGVTIWEFIGEFVFKDMGGEGVEEGYQYIASQEGQFAAKKKHGLVEDSSDFWGRLSDYVVSDEFKTGVLLGAVGGGMFAGAGSITSYKQQQKDLQNRLRLEDLHKQNVTAITKNIEGFAEASDMAFITMAIDKSVTGDLDQMEADLNDLYNEADDAIASTGRDPKEYRAEIDRVRGLVKEVGSTYNKVMNEAIPEDLRSATLYSRVNRKLAEQYKVDISKTRQELFELDRKVFEAKDKPTADRMVRLKELMLNKNLDKANNLAKEIAESSDVYRNVNEVFDFLNTSQDKEFAHYDSILKTLDGRISAAQEFETKLKTEEGQKDIRTKVNAELLKKKKSRDAKAAREAANAAANAESTETVQEPVFDESRLTPEQKTYRAERNKKAQEVGEYDPGKADGKKVFTTFDKTHQRTWIKGEIVKDAKGNKYAVMGPVKGNYAARLVPLDKNGNKKEGATPVLSYKVEGLSHESLRPGRKDIASEWKVNKFVYEDLKAEQAEARKEDAIAEQTVDGIVKTVNKEFSNFAPDEKGNWVFDGIPELEGDQWFDIDFNLAASPMEQGVPQEVELVLDSTKGVDVILVKQNGKIISKISEKDRKGQHEKLVEYISQKGGTITATLKSKHVDFKGNLGTIEGSQNSVSTFIGSEFLPDGKIYIGSRKPKDNFITFTSPDGSSYELPIPESKQGTSIGAGNTYIMLLTPSGDRVAVQLNESRLNEVKDANGLTYAEGTLLRLEAKAAELQKMLDDLVEVYMTKGTESGAIITNKKAAIERAKKVLGLAKADNKREEGEKSEVVKALNEVLGPVTRTVAKTPDGNVSKNYFQVYYNHELDPTGETNGTVTISVIDSMPNPDKGSKYEYKTSTSTDRQSQLDKLGSRFMATSLDIMNSPDGGKYVEKMIAENWFTTDVYAVRPWVNPRLNIQLDPEATIYTSEGVKKPRKKAETSAKKKTRKEKDTETTSDNLKDDKLKEVNSYLMKSKDAILSEGFTEKFIADNLQDLVTEEDFEKLVKDEVSNNPNEYAEMSDKAILRKVYKKVAIEIIENSKEDLDIQEIPTETEKAVKEETGSTKERELQNDIEAKKVEIEKGRKKELDNLSPENLSVMASDYLLTGGVGSILSSDYFIQSLIGSFINASSKIATIRNKYANEVNNKHGNLSDFIKTELYNNIMQEVRAAINSSYSTAEAQEIFDQILISPSGVNPKIGNQISMRLDVINSTVDKINAKYDAELAALNQVKSEREEFLTDLHREETTKEKPKIGIQKKGKPKLQESNKQSKSTVVNKQKPVSLESSSLDALLGDVETLPNSLSNKAMSKAQKMNKDGTLDINC